MFQSTRPVRGATSERRSCSSNGRFQSTRPVRGATFAAGRIRVLISVSIHAPRAGRDGTTDPSTTGLMCFNPRAPCGARPPSCHGCSDKVRFNPRAPCGARRTGCAAATFSEEVSIHAPRAGRDAFSMSFLAFGRCFNPRAPCGARPLLSRLGHVHRAFQSTRPVRGATLTTHIELLVDCFNPRAPCGARRGIQGTLRHRNRFNPRAPCGARHPQYF